MSECKHNRVVREVAIADGMCPICLAADNARLRAIIKQIVDDMGAGAPLLLRATLMAAEE